MLIKPTRGMPSFLTREITGSIKQPNPPVYDDTVELLAPLYQHIVVALYGHTDTAFGCGVNMFGTNPGASGLRNARWGRSCEFLPPRSSHQRRACMATLSQRHRDMMPGPALPTTAQERDRAGPPRLLVVRHASVRSFLQQSTAGHDDRVKFLFFGIGGACRTVARRNNENNQPRERHDRNWNTSDRNHIHTVRSNKQTTHRELAHDNRNQPTLAGTLTRTVTRRNESQPVWFKQPLSP